MKRTIKKAIALAVTTVMALSISVPTLPSTYASTTEENMVIESTTEISTEEAITTEVVTSEVTTEEISTEVTTEITTEATTETTEEKVDEGSTEVTTETTTEASTEVTTEDVTTEESTTETTSTEEFIEEPEFPGLSEEMLYELLFDEEWVTELTDEDIKELYGFDSREEFEEYVEMVVGSKEELEIPEELAWINDYDDDTFYMWMWMSKEEYIEFYNSGAEYPVVTSPWDNMSTYALTNAEWTELKAYMDANMVGAPYQSGDLQDYDNNKSQGWSCAGAINHLLFYKLNQKELVESYDCQSQVPYLKTALLASSDYEETHYQATGLTDMNAAQITELVAEKTQPGDIVIFVNGYYSSDYYGANNPYCPNIRWRKPHAAIADGNGGIYSSLNNGFTNMPAGNYVVSSWTNGLTADKYAAGFAVYSPKEKNGTIRVAKSASDGTIIENNPMSDPNYSMAGATYAVSTSNTTDASGFLANQLGTVEIEDDADNVSSGLTVPAGTYYIQEIIAPTSGTYELNKKIYGPFTVTAGKRLTVGVPSVTIEGENETFNTTPIINYKETVDVYLKKISSKPDTTNGNPNYSTKGTVYYLYKGTATSGTPYKILTVGDNDVSNTVQVPFGLYTAVEQTAGPGYKINTTPITVDLRVTNADGSINTTKVNQLKGTTQIINATDEPEFGSVQVLKVLDKEELDGNECYDKAATYVIRNAQGTQVGTLNTDAVTGLSNVITGLPLGNYTVVETVPSKGCELDTTVHNVTLTSTNASESVPVQVKSVEPTENDPVVIEIYKIDKDGNKVSGGASLAGAEFTITYYDAIFHAEAEIPAQYERQWVISTKYDNTSDTYRAYLTEEYLISGSDLYIDEISGLPYLPLGTITIKETKTPDGYKEEGIFKDENGNEIPNGLYITQIETGNDDIPAVVGGHEFKVSNTVKRGDLAFTKIDHVTLEPMGGIPFKITSATTGESHIYITDNKGVLSTSSSHIKHSKDTNANDGAVKDENGYYSNLTYCGAWFSGTKDGNINELEDGVGALPFDTYIIEELPCAANKDKTLIETQEIVISEDGVEVNDGVYTNVPLPSISTVEKDTETGTHISVADDKVILTDTIHYEYFEAGAKYTAFGVIVDKETEKPLKDAAGNYIISSETFDVDRNWRVNKFEKKGDVDVSFTFDGTGFDGKSFVVFEYVFEGDVTNTHEIIDANGNIDDTGCFAKHAEINSIEQTGMFPSMVTKAWTVESENNTLAMDENVNVVDTVTMENLIVGEDYVLTATIINKATGETLKNEEGKEITGTLEFTATKANDNKDVKFPTLKRKLFENEGSDFVIFEELTWKKSTGDVYYSKHTDINDTDQTLSLVTIGTTATYKGDKVAPATENITITDVVEYKNLTIGKEYTIDGVLYVKSTGKPLLRADGTEVTATKTFTAKAKNGKESLDFTFDATLLQGESVVAFEYLKDKDIEVATHTELDDENQTVEFPKISTTLVESETGLPMVYINKPVKLVDTVEYKDFIPGREYRMVGVLMNKSTGLPLWDSSKNTIITAEIAFTPEEKDGTVNVVFYFDVNNVNLKNEDGSLADIVCFENCYFTDEETSEEIRFAHHEDIESVSQTIRVSSGRTSAKDGTNGTHTGTPEEEATIVDTVYYNNLIPGKSYRIEGKLWTKDKDGNAIPFLDGGKEVVSSVEFTPAEAVGSIEMVFKFNASSLKSSGTTITVFEDCYYEDTDLLVFTHSEIDDKDQQINYPSIITEIKDKNGNKSLEPEHKYTLIDTITYENLTVGETYVIEGVLMEKVETRDEHGTVLSVSEKEYVSPDGNKSTAVVEFTPTEPNGKVDISFEFYTSEDTYNKTFVCFERIYTKATHTEICEHTDINDSKQSFTVTDQVKTGDGPLGIIIALMCFALAGIILMISHKGKNKNIPLIKM